MPKAVKGFVKLFCEKCQILTWHFSEHETLPTKCCCDCNKPKRPEDVKVWGKVVEEDKPKVRHRQPTDTPTESGRTYRKGSSFLRELGIDNSPVPPKVDPLKVFCSFCHKETSHVTSTTGLGSFRVDRYTEVVCNDPLITEDKVKVVARKAIACPDCAHLIKPITHIVDGKEEIKIMNFNSYSEG